MLGGHARACPPIRCVGTAQRTGSRRAGGSPPHAAHPAWFQMWPPAPDAAALRHKAAMTCAHTAIMPRNKARDANATASSTTARITTFLRGAGWNITRTMFLFRSDVNGVLITTDSEVFVRHGRQIEIWLFGSDQRMCSGYGGAHRMGAGNPAVWRPSWRGAMATSYAIGRASPRAALLRCGTATPFFLLVRHELRRRAMPRKGRQVPSHGSGGHHAGASCDLFRARPAVAGARAPARNHREAETRFPLGLARGSEVSSPLQPARHQLRKRSIRSGTGAASPVFMPGDMI